MRFEQVKGAHVAWVIATLLSIGVVAITSSNGTLVLALGALVVGIVAFAMLADLRFALVVSIAAIPIEEFVVFDGAGTLTRLLMLGLAGSYVYHAIRGHIRVRFSALPIVGWSWLFLAVASLMWSQDPRFSQVTSLVQLVMLAFIVAATLAEKPAFTPAILWSYTTSACVIAALGVYRFLTTVETAGAHRASASDAQGVEHFSAYLLPALVLLLLQVLLVKRRWLLRMGIGALLVLVTTGMLVSGTRSAWMAAIAALLLVVVPKLNSRQVGGLAVIGAVVVATALVAPGVSEFVTTRTEIALESGGAGRLDIWRVGIGLVDISPVVGVGYSNFATHFTQQAVLAAPSTLDNNFVGTHIAPHSIYLSNLVDLGVVGAFLFLTWVATLIIRLRGTGLYLVAIRATLFAYLVQGAYLDILNRKYFWLYLGLAEGCRWLMNARDEVKARGTAHSRALDH